MDLNCISDLVHRFQKAETAKPRVVHYNRLKLYHGDYDNWLDKNAVINDTDVQTSDNEQITVSDNKLAESEIFLTMKKPHLQSTIAGIA